MSSDYELSEDAQLALSGILAKRVLRALGRGEGVILYSEHLNRIVERAAAQKEKHQHDPRTPRLLP